MGNFNKRGGGGFGNRGGGRGFGGGGRGGFGGRDRGRSEMHRAVCSECGRECEVPFRPTGDKPVYCNDCFGGGDRGGSNRGGRSDRDRGGRDRDRGRREDRQMYKATCAECGERCEVPFKPSGDKPVLCNECFGGGGSSGPKKQPVQSNQKQDEILAKLDKILALLQRTNPVKEVTVMKEKPKANEAKPASPVPTKAEGSKAEVTDSGEKAKKAKKAKKKVIKKANEAKEAKKAKKKTAKKK